MPSDPMQPQRWKTLICLMRTMKTTRKRRRRSVLLNQRRRSRSSRRGGRWWGFQSDDTTRCEKHHRFLYQTDTFYRDTTSSTQPRECLVWWQLNMLWEEGTSQRALMFLLLLSVWAVHLTVLKTFTCRRTVFAIECYQVFYTVCYTVITTQACQWWKMCLLSPVDAGVV